jgi:hypothetical protein
MTATEEEIGGGMEGLGDYEVCEGF